jgi:hypothetical protein
MSVLSPPRVVKAIRLIYKIQGNVTAPGLIWCAHTEVLVQDVQCGWQVMRRVGRRLELALLLAAKAELRPQPCVPI